MYDYKRKLLSQNFLHDTRLVAKLVRNSSIDPNDTVLEIGPGKGIITRELLACSRTTIGIELDNDLTSYLSQKFSDKPNFILYHQDFLSSSLPLSPYKVFANIPFSIEGKVIRKLVDADNSPEDTYLVINKELAIRLSAAHKENLFSIMHKPWFDFAIDHHFHPYDFKPVPNVRAALFRFTKRRQPLLPWKEKEAFQTFIHQGFGQGLPIIRNLKKSYSLSETLKAMQEIGLRKQAKSSELSLAQWITLYKKIVSVY